MRYTVRKSIVEIVGTIWMPAVTCAQCLTLSSYDVENMRDEDNAITRDSVESWLSTHAGDFQSIQDFHASIEDGEHTIDLPWQSEESELVYVDCMFPSED